MKALLTRIAIVLIASSIHVGAKTIKYPTKDSMFRITVPDDWSTTLEKDGGLKCVPRDRSKYVSVFPSANFTTTGEAVAQLPKIAQEAGENAQMKDRKLGEVKVINKAGNLTLLTINVHGTSHGAQMVFTLVAFAPKKDNYFTLIALEPMTATDKKIGAIINSITGER